MDIGEVELFYALKKLFEFYYKRSSNRTSLSGVYKLPSGWTVQSTIEDMKYYYDYMKIRMNKEDREAIEVAFKAFGFDLEEVSKKFYNDKTGLELVGFIEETLETEYDGEMELGEFYNHYFISLDGSSRWLEKAKDVPDWREYSVLCDLAQEYIIESDLRKWRQNHLNASV